MAPNKFLKQVADMFDMKQRKCSKEKKCLNEALKKLKAREDTLESRLDKEKSDKTRHKLKGELKVVNAQIRKGRKLIKELS